MAEKTGVKLTEDQIKIFKDIMSNFESITYDFGQITLSQMEIDGLKRDLQKKYQQKMKQLKQFNNTLAEKYGEGIINPKDMTYIHNK